MHSPALAGVPAGAAQTRHERRRHGDQATGPRDSPNTESLNCASIEAMSTAIASVGRERFEADLCTLLQTTTGYVSIAIIAFPQHGNPRRLFDNLSCADQERALEPYLAGDYFLDPWYNMILEQAPDGIYLLTEHAPDDFEQSEYFRHYYARAGLHDECAMFIRLSEKICIVISLCVYGATSVSRVDLHRARALFPCISALCRRHWGELSLETTGPRAALEDLCRQRGLSGREVQVTAMVLRGYSNKLIARELAISPETVKVYRKRINRKLGTCSSRQIFTNFFVLVPQETVLE
jgi:DNA-binding CsgD family transcriptional regulator